MLKTGLPWEYLPAEAVERTYAWLARLRRLAVRYERGDDIHLGLTVLGCALVCMNQVGRFCWAFLDGDVTRPERRHVAHAINCQRQAVSCRRGG